MSNEPYRSYYEDDIRSATPQRLRLMLINGAIRFAKAAVDAWDDDRDAAFAALSRCRNIVIELIAGVRADRQSCEYIVDHVRRDAPLTAQQRAAEIDNLETVTRNLIAIYVVVFRCLDEAQLDWNAGKVREAIDVLEVERETAQLLCEKQPEVPALTADRQSAEISSSEAAALLQRQQETAQPTAPPPATYGDAPLPTSSMSFDA